MEKYKIIKKIGDGTYGTVEKATNQQNGEFVAIKKIKKKIFEWEECLKLREVKSLRKLNHPSIIKLKELYLVFEYMPMNLYQYYMKHKKNNMQINEKNIQKIIYQLLQSLSYIHKHGLFHRDLKPENLLLHQSSNDIITKLCDFGLCRSIHSQPPFTDYVATRWYRAPELLLKSPIYSYQVDIFAAGCVMAELYLFKPLFPGQNEFDQLNRILAVNVILKKGTPTQQQWPSYYSLAKKINYDSPQFDQIPLQNIIPQASHDAIDLIQQMIRNNPDSRPLAAKLLQHQFFNNIRKNDKKAEIKNPINIQNSPIIKQGNRKMFKNKFYQLQNQQQNDNNNDLEFERFFNSKINISQTKSNNKMINQQCQNNFKALQIIDNSEQSKIFPNKKKQQIKSPVQKNYSPQQQYRKLHESKNYSPPSNIKTLLKNNKSLLAQQQQLPHCQYRNPLGIGIGQKNLQKIEQIKQVQNINQTYKQNDHFPHTKQIYANDINSQQDQQKQPDYLENLSLRIAEIEKKNEKEDLIINNNSIINEIHENRNKSLLLKYGTSNYQNTDNLNNIQKYM